MCDVGAGAIGAKANRGRGLLFLAALICGLGVGGSSAAAETQRRFAVVVGANKAPAGRKPLRYAHDDARAMVDVLTGAGGFDIGNVDVLMDPTPAAVLKALDRTLASARNSRNSLVLFYYGGHADGSSLYPGGLPLRLADVRARMLDKRAKVRLVVLDVVHSEVPLDFDKAGTAMMAASSGVGKARESDQVRGSLFSHHLTAALRGAGDTSGDGRITITEAAKYARAMTTRDAGPGGAPPSTNDRSVPRLSFRGSLGVKDFAVTTIAPRKGPLTLQQTRGPLELVDVEANRVVLETLPGPRRVGLFVDPGRYQVRRRDPAGVASADVTIPPGGQVVLAEDKLKGPAGADRSAAPAAAPVSRAPAPVTAPAPRPTAPASPPATPGARPTPTPPPPARPVARKPPPAREAPAQREPEDEHEDEDEDLEGLAARPVRPQLVPPGRWNLQLALGFRRARVFDPGFGVNDIGPGLAGIFRAVRGLSPRWQLALPGALVYLGGTRHWQLLPWFGIPALASGNTAAEGLIISGHAGAGLDVVHPLGRDLDLALSGAGLGRFRWALGPIGPCDKTMGPCPTEVSWAARPPGGTWSLLVSAGLGWRITPKVTFNVGLALSDTLLDGDAKLPGPGNPASDVVVAVGSVQQRGLRPLPLLQIALDPRMTLDFSAVASYSKATSSLGQTYLVGLSWLH
jgi:hypothetical protein